MQILFKQIKVRDQQKKVSIFSQRTVSLKSYGIGVPKAEMDLIPKCSDHEKRRSPKICLTVKTEHLGSAIFRYPTIFFVKLNFPTS